MSCLRKGTCGDPGPGDAHCTEPPNHRHSCYDADDDTSWNDRQWEDLDLPAHHCTDAACPGRPS